MTRRHIAVAFLVLALWGGASHDLFARASRPVRPFILRSMPSGGWTVEYARPPLRSTTVDVDGIPHLLFSDEALPDSGKEGEPGLPVESFSLGIPSDGSVSVELLDPVFEVTQDQLVAPRPGYRFTAEREAIAEYRKDPSSYAQNRFFPAGQLTVSRPYVLRQQRVVTVRISPYQYNPATRELRRLAKATLRLQLTSAEGSAQLARAAPPAERFFEDVYRSTLLNYDQARQWRLPQGRLAQTASDPSRDWFQTGATYLRVPVAADGWYRITRGDIAASGLAPNQIDLPSVKLFNRGVEQPVFIRADSSLEFYATMNYGDSTYFDFYTDTNVYWITWGGGGGQRFLTVPQPGGGIVSSVNSAWVTRHFEQNTDYYEGTGEAEVSTNGPVAGEGWVWEYYYPGTTSTHNFALDTIDGVSAPLSRLRVRLFSTTLHYNTPDHIARVWINDSLVGQVGFNGRTAGMIDTNFPTSWLVNGSNRLTITSVSTPSSPNQFYLDWFEIGYQRYLGAVNGQVRFTSPPSSGAGPARITLAGFADSLITVLDLAGRRAITGGTIGGDTLNGFSMAFADTFSTARTYLAVCGSGPRASLPLTQKTFTDIRTNAAGADYIMISHKNFLASAQQLAAHRQSFNGVRVKVIDVQDIYDEFNYGRMNAGAIKSFLRYASTSWATPAPAYVLLLGDASWDFHGYIATTTKVNYVPAYGVPAGDNWYGCFDTAFPFISSLLIGRLPVQDPVQAQHTVTKIIGYDSSTLDEWNKNFMLITGGDTPSEQSTFNALMESSIAGYLAPPPMGGTPYRIYKSGPAVIDGGSKQYMRDLVKDGLVFINFLGHSGGRIWGVDIGSPNDLENTNGRLPFVTSVSCNVGAFAEPSNNVLSEDFVLADNRGAIGMWASAALGFANQGQALVNYLLLGVIDSVRDIGTLTTAARYRLYQTTGSGYVTLAMMNLTPLIGDPLTRLAIPLQPDLAVAPGDLSLNNATPTPEDSVLTLRVNVHNFGLVPTDSVTVQIDDLYNSQTLPILPPTRFAPTYHDDSLFVPWHATNQIGTHTVVVRLDPGSLLDEVTRANNMASIEEYVYANVLKVVKPMNGMVVQPGPQALVVTSPFGLDSLSFQYTFEVDTVSTFDSPFKISSGSVAPGPVSGRWVTPALPEGQDFFWRTRTVSGSLLGNWVVSSFSTSAAAPSLPEARWREYSGQQFHRETLVQAAASDSGVTIAPRTPLFLYARSLGYRADANHDYYSILRLNDVVVTGYWWHLGNSFMVLRLNEFTGSFDFQAFDVAGQAAQSDSMTAFINNTPAGNYIAISVIFDGRTNVKPALNAAIKLLGSTLIDSVQPGQSWSFIGRKGSSGPGMTPLESWSPADVAVDSLQIPNYYSYGLGSIASAGIPIPVSWDSFHWRSTNVPGTTDVRVALVGVKAAGGMDTLRILPRDSSSVSLAFLNPLTAGPQYAWFKTIGTLTSSDPLVTPALNDWGFDFAPPADLAISPRTIIAPVNMLRKGNALGLSVTLFNIGYRWADSARGTVSLHEAGGTLRPVAYATADSIPVDDSRNITIPVPTDGFGQRFTLRVAVSPAAGAKDLIAENNSADYTFDVTGVVDPLSANVQVYADGSRLMDGDYVASMPKIVVRLEHAQGISGIPFVDLYVDNAAAAGPEGSTPGTLNPRGSSAQDEPEFTPHLANGAHMLRVRVARINALGGTDSLVHTIAVNVLDDYRILDLYNFPNPFARDTYFTMKLTGARPPEQLTIRIYTVTGRKIRQITVPQSDLRVGPNRVYWDGRDSDGDEIANGYYFYQVEITGEGKTRTAIEKLVKLR